jgi:hypothetical protein
MAAGDGRPFAGSPLRRLSIPPPDWPKLTLGSGFVSLSAAKYSRADASGTQEAAEIFDVAC